MGVAFELDDRACDHRRHIACGGGGRITGTVIGTIILGVVTSGFTFLRAGAYYREIVKGMIIDVQRQRRKARV